MPEYARYIRGGTEDKPYLAIQEKELLETNKWSSIFKKPVHLSKVRIDVLRPWINKRINELMGIEDEILVEYIMTQLKEASQRENTKDLADIKLLDPKLLVVNITGFMAKKAQPFVAELWAHMLSAQETEHGVPTEFIQDKKHEIEMLKQKSRLLENELVRQKEVKRESALEQIARGRDKSESPEKYRHKNRFNRERRYRDREYDRRRRRERRSGSRSRSYSPRRYKHRRRSDSRDSDYDRRSRDRHRRRRRSDSRDRRRYRSSSRDRRRRSDSQSTPSNRSKTSTPRDSMSTSE